jgi:membrane protease YdiL (CAAX protease family)
MRLRIYIFTTFAISLTSWGILAHLSRAGITAFGQPRFMLLFSLGGLGPTIGAYLAVLATTAQSPLAEYHQRLFRWRVDWKCYLAAFGLPAALVLGSATLAIVFHSGSYQVVMSRPWFALFPLFVLMIFFGGLEELGWRGVAQPEMERLLPRAPAAIAVGIIWAVWHLPLFYVPGVSQYGTSFRVFFLRVLGNALILAWIYGRSKSILLCGAFHAMRNAAWAMGLTVQGRQANQQFFETCLGLACGVLLMALDWGSFTRSGKRGPARNLEVRSPV